MYKAIEELQIKLCHHFSINLMQTRDKLLKVALDVVLLPLGSAFLGMGSSPFGGLIYIF